MGGELGELDISLLNSNLVCLIWIFCVVIDLSMYYIYDVL